jgi:hypothetical protein
MLNLIQHLILSLLPSSDSFVAFEGFDCCLRGVRLLPSRAKTVAFESLRQQTKLLKRVTEDLETVAEFLKTVAEALDATVPRCRANPFAWCYILKN